MKSQKTITESRGSIALTKETIETIKSISTKNSIKMYEFVGTMINIISEDGTLVEKIVQTIKQKNNEKKELKQISAEINHGKVSLSKNISTLPTDLRVALFKLSAEELRTLLENSDKQLSNRQS